jgi:hypothetical protein
LRNTCASHDGEQRFDHFRAEAVSDHHAIDFSRNEILRRRLHAESADQSDALADRDGQC